MICSEAREYLFAFLDNELDAPLSIELQLHLEHCPICAREVEIERAIREQLACVLEAQSPEKPLNMPTIKRIIRRDEALGFLRRSLSRRAFWAACAAAVFVVGLGAYLTVQKITVGPDRHKFVDLVVSDFVHFLKEGQPIQFVSSDGQAISDWLLRKTALEVVLPRAKGPYCRLVGARKCEIEGQVAAFIVYEMRGIPTSLVAIAGRNNELEEMKQIEHNGQIHWVDNCEGFSVVAYRQDNLVYAMVSKLSQQELIHFLSEADDESN
jgi:anti-sigma factor RsiW